MGNTEQLKPWVNTARPLEKSVRLKKTAVLDNRELTYLLQLPRLSGGIEEGVKYPLILFLHGHGGHKYIDELLDGKHEAGLMQDHLELSREFPFFVLGPRIRDNTFGWDSLLDLVIKALDDVVAGYPVDQDRIYLAGFSMGGFGAYNLAAKCPDRFAAMAPSAGLTDLNNLEKIKDIPIWVFHSVKDEVISYTNACAIVKRLRELGSKVIFTVYPGGHSLETTIYAEGTFQWFLKHRKHRGS